jgi:hypothetical protein
MTLGGKPYSQRWAQRCHGNTQLQSSGHELWEPEHAEQIVDCGAICWHIGVPCHRDRIGQIIPAPVGDRRQPPVPLYKLQDGNVVGIIMHDAAAL